MQFFARLPTNVVSSLVRDHCPLVTASSAKFPIPLACHKPHINQHRGFAARLLNEERAGCDQRTAFRWAVKRYAEAGFERTEPADLLPAAICVTYTVDFRRTRYNYVLLAERAIDRRAASNGYVGIF